MPWLQEELDTRTMDSEEDVFYASQEFRCAMLGVKAGLAQFEIAVDDDVEAQVATSVLMAFYFGGGLAPEFLERLRVIIDRAATRKEH